MTESRKIEQLIREVLASETHPIALSERLFAPGGLFNELAKSEGDRRLIVQSPLFQEAQARLRELQRPAVVPYEHFSAASDECGSLYRNGHYYGCIALTQAVTEALVRFVWQVRIGKARNQGGKFEDLLKDLWRKKLIPQEVRDKLDTIWSQRNDYIHLTHKVEQDPQKLRVLAREKLELLGDVERYFFGYTFDNGALVPNHREYWPIAGGDLLAYVRGNVLEESLRN